MTGRSVGVIGAGAAGICGAKHMLEEGCEVTVYEKGSVVGGMWDYDNDNGEYTAYKTLHINTARDLTNFSDFRFEPSVPPFPSHWDMSRYLKRYADHFGVTRRIRFRATVDRLAPAPDYHPERPRWRLALNGREMVDHDCIIVASGHLTRPREVAMFRDGFEGEYLHSRHYRDPAAHVGKRVCVVGIGNSALDIASDLAMTSAKTVLVARSSALIIPKLAFGRPFWETIQPFYRPWVPAWVRTRALRALVYVIHGSMADLGFPPTAKRVHATSNANIVNHIKYRRVLVKQGIDRVEGRRLTFTDGSSEEFDTLIAATGFKLDLDILAEGLVAGDPETNTLDLYMRIVPPRWRGLYFLAFFNSDTALNWICEGQVRWLRELEMGRAVLPSATDMEAEIAARKAQVAADFKDTPRHGIEVEHMPYFADLKRTLKEAQRRARTPLRDPGIAAVNRLPIQAAE
jgi:cation diffusion facilitator CzcD-associated flavoprotein CzcO